jgi:hypothetical protein
MDFNDFLRVGMESGMKMESDGRLTGDAGIQHHFASRLNDSMREEAEQEQRRQQRNNLDSWNIFGDW